MPLLFSVSGVLGRDAVQVAMLRSFATGGVFVFFGWQAAEVHGGSAIGFLVCSTTAHPHNQRPAYVAAAGLSLQLCKKAHLFGMVQFPIFFKRFIKTFNSIFAIQKSPTWDKASLLPNVPLPNQWTSRNGWTAIN